MLLSEFMGTDSGDSNAVQRYKIRRKIGRGAFADVRTIPHALPAPNAPSQT